MRTPRNYEPLRETHRQVDAQQEPAEQQVLAGEPAGPTQPKEQVDLRDPLDVEIEEFRQRVAEKAARGVSHPTLESRVSA